MCYLLATLIFISLYLCIFTATFYIKYALLYISAVPEDDLCRPKHLGEITTTQQIITKEYMCHYLE
jgi:hypothetical protein